MRYISGLHEGETIRNIYLCKGKRSAETRNGKPYDNVLLQDKTGTLDGKVWDPNSQGIADYDEKDFIEVYGEVINYNGNLQINIKQIRKAGEEKNKTAVVNVNWPQAVLRLHYTEAQMQECITMEDANEGEKE